MAIGVCRREDIAVSVLATVIGHNPRTGRILVDAGALALSHDKGAAGVMANVGYGWVLGEKGDRLDGLFVAEVNQEHGMIASPSGAPCSASTGSGTLLKSSDRPASHTCVPGTVTPWFSSTVIPFAVSARSIAGPLSQ
jgi:D-serine deaminase-like pyridoxal phosphate-dependent protein